MAFWGLKVEPGKWTPFVPPPDEALRLHISQVSPLQRASDRPRKSRRRPPPTLSPDRSERTRRPAPTEPSAPQPMTGHPRRRYPRGQGAHHRQVPRRGRGRGGRAGVQHLHNHRRRRRVVPPRPHLRRIRRVLRRGILPRPPHGLLHAGHGRRRDGRDVRPPDGRRRGRRLRG